MDLPQGRESNNMSKLPFSTFNNHPVLSGYRILLRCKKASRKLSVDVLQPKGKKAIYDFVRRNGKIPVIIGIAKGEERRIQDKTGVKWMDTNFKKIYPLVDEGVDRAKAQEIIKKYGHEIPIPSNCMICPYMSLPELYWLYRFKPSMYKKIVQMEKDKIAHQAIRDPEKKNYGVFGAKLIPEKIKDAEEKYGHWSDEQLHEYKMSHGHCSKAKF